MDGDLISRKALLEILNAKSDVAIATPAQMIYANAAKIVELLPAVDAEPVRHGKCELCGRGKPIKAFTILPDCGLQYGMSIMARYCPNCGARMDGEDDNGRS